MILNALAGKPLPVYGNGQQVRDWLYVEDHARALLDHLDLEQVHLAGHSMGGAVALNCARLAPQLTP